jgi:hypothetical protein
LELAALEVGASDAVFWVDIYIVIITATKVRGWMDGEGRGGRGGDMYEMEVRRSDIFIMGVGGGNA